MNKLRELLTCCGCRRERNTTALLEGVKNVDDACVVVHKKKMADILDLDKDKVIALSEIPLKLYGQHTPIVVDLKALSVMYSELEEKLTKKDNKIRRLEEKLEKIENIINQELPHAE